MKLVKVHLPGKGRPRNLVNMDTYEECPCCGAMWKNGRPWTETVISAAQYAEEMGVTVQSVTAKCRKGIIAAYQGPSDRWLIPLILPPKK